MRITLATRNPSKIDQIRLVFAGTPVTVLSFDDVNVAGEAVEDGDTLGENALKKAQYAWDRVGGWVMSDDTGVFIDALDGRPGIHAARWAGADATTQDILVHTLKCMGDVEESRRTGAFRTAAVVIDPLGKHRMFVGEVTGRFLTEPRVDSQPKMPYSGIFLPDGQTKVWAEMSIDEENAMSHRGKAFAQVREFLLSCM